MLLLFPLGKLLLYGGIQTLPHLSRRRPGESHDQKLVDIHRPDRV